jgi:uncharacterized protein YuzE
MNKKILEKLKEIKPKYDKENDITYMKLNNNKIYDTEQLENGMIVDYDKDDNIVGIELLNFKNNQDVINIPIDINNLKVEAIS